MEKPKKITPSYRALQRKHTEYETARKNLTRELLEVVAALPLSESEVCRRVGISRSAWANYKAVGFPFAKFGKIIDFLNGLIIENKRVIL